MGSTVTKPGQIYDQFTLYLEKSKMYAKINIANYILAWLQSHFKSNNSAPFPFFEDKTIKHFSTFQE